MVDKRRMRRLNDHEYKGGQVLYWMDRDMRLFDNWAVHAAAQLAKQHDQPFGIVYNLVNDYLGGGARQLQFKLQGLKDLEENCKKKNIPFFVLTDDVIKALPKMVKDHDIGMIVTDFNPLKISTKWKKTIAKAVHIPVVQVDAHNIIPCWVASPKEEFAAYTFRPKVKKQLGEFLTDFPNVMKQKMKWAGFPKHSWKELHALKANEDVKPVDWISGGEQAAKNGLMRFIENGIDGYDEKRNDPNEDAQSGLSPWLHYGNIGAQTVALAVKKSTAKKADREAFLEELIVRKELSDNYCFYNENYDNAKGFHDWAKKTVIEHKKDKREYTYTRKQFEEAKTHEDLWNAAQMQLVKSGKLHGYMRMYWAKKILEWTQSVDEAMKIAIYLNDKYELDGRDPNGYTGVAWSIGGVHDRAWTERPVFGKIRYMNLNGAKRKFDVDAYVQKWLN